MKLVLAEKPSVAQSIAKVLGAAKREDGYLEGNGYVVSWCVGHLVELAQPEVYDAKYSKWAYADYIHQFMEETFETPYYLRRSIEVKFSELTAEWRINGKSSPNYNDVAAYVTYGTERANAYRILEETLNLKDIRIYDTIEDADGKQKRVLNKKETTLAQQKQQAIKDAFRDWIWRDTDSLRSKKSTSHDALRIVLVDFFCKDIKIDIHISP